MFGLTEYAAAGAVVIAVGVAGAQTVRMQVYKADKVAAELDAALARGALDTCANRIINMQEAEESNASIPDNLMDFDPAAAGWLLDDPASTATD